MRQKNAYRVRRKSRAISVRASPHLYTHRNVLHAVQRWRIQDKLLSVCVWPSINSHVQVTEKLYSEYETLSENYMLHIRLTLCNASSCVLFVGFTTESRHFNWSRIGDYGTRSSSCFSIPLPSLERFPGARTRHGNFTLSPPLEWRLQHRLILIHCSARVGRTGTLVAIDNLIQQVEKEGPVSVLNTVCDLRHQRNFLVQSLRQYIFGYRTLIEWVQFRFGNTEIAVANFPVLHYIVSFDVTFSNIILKTEFIGQLENEDWNPELVSSRRGIWSIGSAIWWSQTEECYVTTSTPRSSKATTTRSVSFWLKIRWSRRSAISELRFCDCWSTTL